MRFFCERMNGSQYNRSFQSDMNKKIPIVASAGRANGKASGRIASRWRRAKQLRSLVQFFRNDLQNPTHNERAVGNVVTMSTSTSPRGLLVGLSRRKRMY